jgi:hypothetical protein
MNTAQVKVSPPSESIPNFNHTEGARRSREPGVHNRRLRVMDSALATWRWRPEMTAEALWTPPPCDAHVGKG